ncbi:MAG: Hpt domain-containing protein [Alphaproteobacteria bacterium]|nr:Hpt domain-containing protein [Alphaproteobacteria bacterium]
MTAKLQIADGDDNLRRNALREKGDLFFGTGRPGLDVRQALHCLGGDKKTLRSMLVQLVENTVGLVETLRSDLEAGDDQQAARRVHFLRGSAGNVGAFGLASLAGDIEAAILGGRTDDLPNLLGTLEAAARAFQEDVSAIPEEDEKREPKTSSLDRRELNQLITLLRDGNLAAFEVCKSIDSSLRVLFSAECYNAFVAAMEKLDFIAAAAAFDMTGRPSK